ncbi:MAG: electron transfer flavoprotein subunit alpha/FixB family protein [Desulfurococcales archaeon]|nr:electron transfer flavoprotein subunit alpha/FixB family protein [Desulfurococcales archaeon]
MNTGPDCGKLCPEWSCIDPREYRGVWVVAEVDEDGIKEASLQMMTPALKIASNLGEEVTGVLVGYGVERYSEELIAHGASRVIVVDDPRLSTYYPDVYAKVVASLAEKFKSRVILVAATMRGREMAPYIANTLRTGITADCTDFDVDPETREVVMIRPPFGAIMLAHIKTPTRRPQIGTARPNVFPVPPRDESRRGEVVRVNLEDIPKPSARLVSVRKIPREEVPIEKAEVIVSGGKGVGGPEGFKLLERLAQLLGGVVAGSRKAVDAGWLPPERQVGQTGKTVKPVIYIAVGISGAAQHMFGVREAGVIVAINTDPNAPIFRQADYGVIADYREVIPRLIELLESAKGSNRRSNLGT